MTGYGTSGDYAYLIGSDGGEILYFKISNKGKQIYDFDRDEGIFSDNLDDGGRKLYNKLTEHYKKKQGS
jgi:hypothetical protein